ncbi:Homeobox protein Hox-B2 [Myotis brandtii]|uniref:Homeobox protein Hox-B2 n=1 Tax=Myotis brandtii TaxID=109478 RepID=S7PLH7_MYOBR|nr:Homeobox protein Hox-B2 [Myotis brandtii]
MKEKKSAKKPSPSATSPPAASSVPASGVGSPTDLNFFAADSCLQLSGGLSPSLQGSLDSPVPFSEEDLDFFTSTLCAIDLQFP